MSIAEKVAYLKGLAEGMGISDETNEGKLFRVMIDVLDDIALELSDIQENAEDLGEEIDQLSDDLALLEEEVYGGDEEHACDECDEDEDDSILYSVRCTSCGNTITVDEDVLELGSLDCPNCGEPIELNDDSVEALDDED